MQSRTFADLYALIQALCGVAFAAIEKPRIKALVNRRVQKAYRSSNYWPRYLKVGEERTVANGSLIGYTQSGLLSIDTFLRIHKIAHYMTASSQEYDFMVGSTGATLIAGTLNPTTAFVTYKAQLSTDQLGDDSGEDPNVPYEWFQYLAHGTYADYLRAEGQQEKAAIADQEAAELLQDELIRIDEQHTLQTVANRIFTTGNTQSR
jgi:hypothetical protein